jgi:hypothetical protein
LLNRHLEFWIFMQRQVFSRLTGLGIVSLTIVLQACTSLPKTSEAAPAPRTADRPIAPGNNSAAAVPPVISSEPLPIADAGVQPDRAPSKPQPEFCARENYQQFFWPFVQDNDGSNHKIRSRYSADKIQVRDYNDPNQVLEVIEKQDYQGFKIASLDYTLVYDDPAITDPNAKARLKREVKRIDDNTFRVDYVRAEFEVDPEAEDNNGKLIRTYGAPGAYIFEHRQGCWTLTQELRTVVSGTDRTAKPNPDGVATPKPEAVIPLLHKGMNYPDLEAIVLQNGWVSAAGPGCSGDGHCLMNFEHKTTGKTLWVKTYGPTPAVTDWGISAATTP